MRGPACNTEPRGSRLECGRGRAKLALVTTIGETAAAGLPARLVEPLLADRDRWPLWLPPAFGAGIGVYFSLPVEPPAVYAAIVVALAAASLLLVRRRPALAWPLLMVLLAALGFAAACCRTAWVAAPILEGRIGPVAVEGRILTVDPTAGGRRLLLEGVTIAGRPADRTPARMRLSLRGNAGADLAAGDRIRVRATLRPPSPPSAPGAFDFQRFLYFQGVGATGFALGPPERLPALDDQSWAIWLSRLRWSMTQRIQAVLPGDVGAVAAALITGDRTAISEEVEEAMRRSGLAHLLSISGLHIGIVAGFVFFLIRGGLALAEPVALRRPIKKWAAVCGIVAALAYSILAGWTVPTQRSFLMTGLVLFAILVDRSALSMHVIAWAAFAVLAMAPEALANPGFQMSFAAVVVLIAGYEVLQPHVVAWRADGGPVRRAALYVGGMVFSSLLATVATAPFAAFHFNQFAVYGIAANMVAVPLSAVLIMPAALIAVLLMPFGAEAIALVPMGWGVDLVNQVALAIAGWPAAVIKVPAFPVAALAAITLGGLWLAIWQLPWRCWGLAAIGAGMVAAAVVRPPDLLVSPDGSLMAINGGARGLAVSGSGSRQIAGSWAARFAEEQAGTFDQVGEALDLTCDKLGCRYRLNGRVIVMTKDARALADDCREADVLISVVPVRGRCPRPEVVVDRFALWRAGAHALWIAEDSVTVRSVRDDRGVRPWAPAPEARPR